MNAPNRRSTIALNKPSCEECKTKECLDTGEICKDVELWVSQDYVGSTSMAMMQNKPTPAGSPIEYIDLVNYHNRMPEVLSDDISIIAWNKVKSLRLKPNHLEILRIFYKEGKRLCECAVCLKITDQAAWIRKHYAKRAVKDRLDRLEKWKKIRHMEFKSPSWLCISEMYFHCLVTRKEIGDELGASTIHVARVIRKILKMLD